MAHYNTLYFCTLIFQTLNNIVGKTHLIHIYTTQRKLISSTFIMFINSNLRLIVILTYDKSTL